MCSAALKSVFGSCNPKRGEGTTQKVMIAKTARRSRILIVEDVQETRDAIKELLLHDGFWVDPARDEDEAVDRIQRNHADVILVSLGELLEQIATAQRIRGKGGLTQQTPIVIFSLAAVPEGAEEELGENIHVTAPDNFNQLRDLLTRVLGAASRTH
jgi:CheY-like chemotaxis protein